MSISILVPFADRGCEWRARAWGYVRNHYTTNHPDWELVVGAGDDDPWSKGAAIADALDRCTGDTLVLADADSWIDPDALRRAVSASAAWAVPHGKVYRLSQRGTERLYAGTLQRGHTVRTPYIGPAGGGIVVVSRSAFEIVGGIDRRFLGWGGEDVSLGWALDTLIGPYTRIGAPLYHLWHPHPAPNLRGSPEAEALVARYRAARRDPQAMAALVAEHSTPRGREVTAG